VPDLPVARPYATALFETARGDDTVDVIEGELHEIDARLRSDPDILRLLRSPQLTTREKRALVDATLARGVSEHVQDFLHLLLDKGRIDGIEQIIRCYIELAERSRGILRGTVRTAVPLSDEEHEALTARLSKATGKTVVLAASVDPTLIGGVVVQMQDTLLDSSVQQRLADLRQALLATRVL
jgi:F-type H+-transporting ATPase subunit delta